LQKLCHPLKLFFPVLDVVIVSLNTQLQQFWILRFLFPQLVKERGSDNAGL
jgi:hypothetical protein